MNNLNLRIKLNKADIVQSAHLDPANYRDKEGLEYIPPKRGFQLSIKGSVKDLLTDKDLIIFDDKDATTSIHQGNTADSIAVSINVFDKNDNNLLANPFVSIHDRTLYIGDINFSFEQFEFIKSMVDDQFTTLIIELVKHVTDDEILESRERNKGHVISIDYDLDNLNYSTERKEVDGEDLKALLIKHDLYSVRVGCFYISSSKPKYVKKGEWIDDVWSVENEEQEQAEYNKIYESQGNPQQSLADPNGSSKVNISIVFWMKVLAILLVILIFKI